MWLRCVWGFSLRPAISSIMRWRGGLTVLVSLMGSSILSEVDDTPILRTGVLHPLLKSSQPATAFGLLLSRSGLKRSDFVLWHITSLRHRSTSVASESSGNWLSRA